MERVPARAAPSQLASQSTIRVNELAVSRLTGTPGSRREGKSNVSPIAGWAVRSATKARAARNSIGASCVRRFLSNAGRSLGAIR